MSVAWSPGPKPDPVEFYRIADDTLDTREDQKNFWIELLCLAAAFGFIAAVAYFL